MLEKLLRISLTALLRCFFRVEVRGLEHYEAVRGQRTVIIANHQSFLDPMLLAVFMPEKPAFAMNVFQAEKWYFRPLLKLVDVFRVDPSKPMSTKSIIQRLKGGQKVVVFPEGRITTTGGIMKVYEGTGLIIDRTDALILPIRIEGAQYSKFSHVKTKLKTRWFPKITLTFLPPVTMGLPETLQGRIRRARAAQRVYDILVDATFLSKEWKQPLLRAVAQAAARHGAGTKVIVDVTRDKISYRALFTRAFVLRRLLARQLGNSRYVGLLLPTSTGALVTFMALHMLRRVPAMLNFSAGERNVLFACEAAQVETVITSRAFVERGKLEGLIAGLQTKCRVIFLEDLREHVKTSDKIVGMQQALMLLRFGRNTEWGVQADEPAVVLFTSGTEGTPKGVVLSHANLLSNVAQVASVFPFTESDVMMNALPVFHSFGLTAGMLLPLLLGFRVMFYPNPLHYRVVPELIYDLGATIMLGTDTFYSGYARYAHGYDFQSLRLAVAGAEKLKPATRQLYAERFQVHIQEGYGVTEASPVIACNTPISHKVGSVGRLMPGIEVKLEPVEGLEKGSRLLVKGPNIMLGYLRTERPGVLESHGEWYDTGDIVEIAADGFITILGRAKRFAKVGGEMVSLTVAEESATVLWPEYAHAAMAVNDVRKGEHIVLVTEYREATREQLISHMRESGQPEIAFPRGVTYMEAIPRLGSGKIDYMRLKDLLGAIANAA